MKSCEEISKFVMVNYKHDGPEISMPIKNMEKPTINFPKFPEDRASRVDIFVCGNKYNGKIERR